MCGSPCWGVMLDKIVCQAQYLPTLLFSFPFSYEVLFKFPHIHKVPSY